MKERAGYLDEVDLLTGIGNRKYMEKQVEACTKQGWFWVIDLDSFHMVQSDKGILFADEVICDVVRALHSVMPEEMRIARILGDEFFVLHSGSQDRQLEEETAQKVLEAVRHLYDGDRILCDVRASIGITVAAPGDLLENLEEQAQKAVAHVKTQGGNGYAFYKEEYQTRHAVTDLNTDHKVELFEMLPRENVTEYNFRFLADTKDDQSAINLLMKRSPEFYGADYCLLFLAEKENYSLTCAYEGRADKTCSFYDRKITFSEETWQERLNRMQEREVCGEYRYGDFERAEWKDVFAGLSEDAQLLHAFMCVGDSYVGDIFLASCDGRKKWTKEDKSNLEAFAKVLGYYLVAKKKTEKKENKRAESRDALTGLYNLQTFLDVSEEYLLGTEDPLALVYVDIGNFKSINKNYGYETGDQVLRECAKYLKESVPEVICVGRVYGDKFAVLCREGRGLDEEEIKENSHHVNAILQEKIRKLCKKDNIIIHTGLYHLDSETDMNVALSKAKVAKNIAKQQWSGKMVIFEEWMDDAARRSYELIGSLDAAIANREFMVYLQPKVNSENMKVVGAEALVRWKKADGTMVFPDEFIPVFEKNGRIVDVDYYVYEEVFAYIRKRLDAQLPVVPISMNVSRVHLKDMKFFDKINMLLDKYQVPCEYLEFEITENVYVEKMQEAMHFIENIRKKKIRVSIDDFGSGYSSLNVISSIPMDVLKLDKVFMKRGEELTKKDQVVISHLVKLAKDIELEVLCEGVETQVQADFVKQIGCNAWQGYYFAKPMPMEEFDKYLDTLSV